MVKPSNASILFRMMILCKLLQIDSHSRPRRINQFGNILMRQMYIQYNPSGVFYAEFGAKVEQRNKDSFGEALLYRIRVAHEELPPATEGKPNRNTEVAEWQAYNILNQFFGADQSELAIRERLTTNIMTDVWK